MARMKKQKQVKSNILDTAEDEARFYALTDKMWKDVEPELPLGKAFLKFWEWAGGDRNDIRTAAILWATIRAKKKLAKKDLPGPDEYLRPIVLNFVHDIVTELVDDFFEGRMEEG